jgi:hypothetical protein
LVNLTRLTLTTTGITASTSSRTIPAGDIAWDTSAVQGGQFRLGWNLLTYGVHANMALNGNNITVTGVYIDSVTTVNAVGTTAYIDSIPSTSIDISNFANFRVLLRRNP